MNRKKLLLVLLVILISLSLIPNAYANFIGEGLSTIYGAGERALGTQQSRTGFLAFLFFFLLYAIVSKGLVRSKIFETKRTADGTAVLENSGKIAALSISAIAIVSLFFARRSIVDVILDWLNSVNILFLGMGAIALFLLSKYVLFKDMGQIRGTNVSTILSTFFVAIFFFIVSSSTDTFWKDAISQALGAAFLMIILVYLIKQGLSLRKPEDIAGSLERDTRNIDERANRAREAADDAPEPPPSVASTLQEETPLTADQVEEALVNLSRMGEYNKAMEQRLQTIQDELAAAKASLEDAKRQLQDTAENDSLPPSARREASNVISGIEPVIARFDTLEGNQPIILRRQKSEAENREQIESNQTKIKELIRVLRESPHRQDLLMEQIQNSLNEIAPLAESNEALSRWYNDEYLPSVANSIDAALEANAEIKMIEEKIDDIVNTKHELDQAIETLKTGSPAEAGAALIKIAKQDGPMLVIFSDALHIVKGRKFKGVDAIGGIIQGVIGGMSISSSEPSMFTEDSRHIPVRSLRSLEIFPEGAQFEENIESIRQGVLGSLKLTAGNSLLKLIERYVHKKIPFDEFKSVIEAVKNQGKKITFDAFDSFGYGIETINESNLIIKKGDEIIQFYFDENGLEELSKFRRKIRIIQP